MGEHIQEYAIKAIQSFPFKKGYVAVFLTPRDKIDDELEEPCPFKMQNLGGGPVPKEVQTMLMGMISKQKHDNDVRDIMIIVTETDFYGFGWEYGDIISGDFKKIQNGKSINPFEKEDKIK